MNEFLVCNTGAASVHAIVMMCTAVIPWWWRWRRFSVKVYPLLTPHRCTSNAAAPHCNCSYLRCNRKLQTKAKWNCNNTALEMNAQEKKSHDLLPIIKMYRDKLKTTTPRYLFISSLYIYMRLSSTLAHTHTHTHRLPLLFGAIPFVWFRFVHSHRHIGFASSFSSCVFLSIVLTHLTRLNRCAHTIRNHLKVLSSSATRAFPSIQFFTKCSLNCRS